MKFYQNWKVIYRDFFATNVCLFILLLFALYIPLLRNGNYFVFFLILLLNLIFLLSFIFVFYITGLLTDYIFLTESSIVLRRKKHATLNNVKEWTEIKWDEIVKIFRTKQVAGNAFIFWDKYGQWIWFDYNEKIENYICTNHPELEPLIPAKDDIRKWQEWDVKL